MVHEFQAAYSKAAAAGFDSVSSVGGRFQLARHDSGNGLQPRAVRVGRAGQHGHQALLAQAVHGFEKVLRLVRFEPADRGQLQQLFARAGRLDYARVAARTGQHAELGKELDVDTLFERLIDLLADSRHFITGAPIYDAHAGSAQAQRRPRSIHGRVTAADNDHIFAVKVDGPWVWIGTEGGLARLDKRTGEIESWREEDGLPWRVVSALAADPETGELWVGTRGGGLNALDRASGRWQLLRNDASDPASLPDDDVRALLEDLLPASVRMRLFQCFTDAAVSEQVARMVAMKAATDAAGEMITTLTRQYNRARQTHITMELLDIIGGATALAVGLTSTSVAKVGRELGVIR